MMVLQPLPLRKSAHARRQPSGDLIGSPTLVLPGMTSFMTLMEVTSPPRLAVVTTSGVQADAAAARAAAARADRARRAIGEGGREGSERFGVSDNLLLSVLSLAFCFVSVLIRRTPLPGLGAPGGGEGMCPLAIITCRGRRARPSQGTHAARAINNGEHATHPPTDHPHPTRRFSGGHALYGAITAAAHPPTHPPTHPLTRPPSLSLSLSLSLPLRRASPPWRPRPPPSRPPRPLS